VIPRAHITAWRHQAPWNDDDLVEHDLVLSRALIELFSHPLARAELAFRGGTALHKLILPSPARYSEDIDLVQLRPAPIRPIMQAIHDQLDAWLGPPATKQGPTGVKLIYGFETESEPKSRRKLKIEIHTREHLCVLGRASAPYSVTNPWFAASLEIPTYRSEELIGTKLRALYQRKKGRDLFDLALALRVLEIEPDKVVHCFSAYTASTPVSRAEFEANLHKKSRDPSFIGDVQPLLAPDHHWAPEADFVTVSRDLVARIPGAPWRGPGVAPDSA
jgi:predicted nucleotidyltransferase component of viral defense system